MMPFFFLILYLYSIVLNRVLLLYWLVCHLSHFAYFKASAPAQKFFSTFFITTKAYPQANWKAVYPALFKLWVLFCDTASATVAPVGLFAHLTMGKKKRTWHFSMLLTGSISIDIQKISDCLKDIQKFFKSRPSRNLSLYSFRNGKFEVSIIVICQLKGIL